ncbi:TadE/TadG family type IV pilus assembly protein [Aestuariimicrobium sp. Y1814]|uniref:TadE/TadG family type IV pilus assembly protein n=1 Tax=Aestuariimicrobium sp. Y1814 TaxID=3418742 RepID=UPI003DA7220B
MTATLTNSGTVTKSRTVSNSRTVTNSRTGAGSGPSRGSRGMSPAVEAVVIVPLVLLLVGVMTAGFRLWQGRAEVTDVAGAAARAASQARSTAEANRRIQAVVGSNPLPCDNPRVSADLSGFGRPAGADAQVAVTITCRVAFADLLVPGLPGGRQVSATGTAPLDPYRKRQR